MTSQLKNKNITLYYIHDPMCSWCYGFKPVLNQLMTRLQNRINITFLLGGLAPDSDDIMPKSMQAHIQSNWQHIEKSIPGIKFNFEFWKKCTPRRSTYPSCRAVIAAKKQNPDYELNMIEAIQNAYYSKAQNPSDYTVLYELSETIGLDSLQFIADIHSDTVDQKLMQEISQCRKIGADSYPSLYLLSGNTYYPLVLDYNNVDVIIDHIESYLKNEK